MPLYVTHNPAPAIPAVSNNECTVLVGQFGYLENVLQYLGLATSSCLVRDVTSRTWTGLPTAKRLALPAPTGEVGTELLTQSERFCDPQNRIKLWKDLHSAASFAEPSAAAEAKSLADDVRQAPPEEQPAMVQAFLRRHPEFEAAMPITKTLTAECLDVLAFFESLSSKAAHSELVVKVAEKLANVRQQIDADGQALRQDLGNYRESIAGLSLLKANGGMNRPVHLVNTSSVSELLSTGRSAFTAWLDSVNAIGYADIGFLNPVSRVDGLRGLADELAAKRRFTIYGSLSVRNVDQALTLASESPVANSIGAGSVCVTIGSVTHRGFRCVPTAAVLGRRLAMDGIESSMESGEMMAMFGPLANRALVGIDDCSTADWNPDVLRTLSRGAGFNAIFKQKGENLSLFLNRSQSALEGYQQADGSRFCSILTDRVMGDLDQILPGTPNVPAIRRAAVDTIEERRLKPYRRYPSFFGELTATTSTVATTANLRLKMAIAEAIEAVTLSTHRESKVY